MEPLEEYINKLTGSTQRNSAFSKDIPFQQWRDGLAAAFTERLGGFPEIAEELRTVLLERTVCSGYTRERIEITTYEGLRMPLYLLLPDQPLSTPAPAVLAIHGHGYGSREIVGLDPGGAERPGDPGLHKDLAVSLARQGLPLIHT
ncbi:dienelactone hydrolase, partial [Paenibacillus riograndensis]